MASKMAAESCWLCRVDLSSGYMKKKRSRLTGRKSVKRNVDKALKELAEEYLEVDLIEEASYQAGLVCSRCVAKVECLEKKKTEVVKLRDEILRMIEDNMTNTETSAVYDAVGLVDDFRMTSPAGPSPSHSQTQDTSDQPIQRSTTTPSRKRQSSSVNVDIKHISGKRSVDINSPWTTENVKRVVRKSYGALSSSVVRSSRMSESIVQEIGRKCTKEIKNMGSARNMSKLYGFSSEALRNFSWDTLWEEFSTKTPTLLAVIQSLLNNQHKDDKAFVCFIISLLVKSHNKRMALLQRALSVMFYGKGVSKKMFTLLQPLMICLSHPATIRLIERLSKGHDSEVTVWSKKVAEEIKMDIDGPTSHPTDADFSFLDRVEGGDSDTDNDPITPTYSPVTSENESETDSGDTEASMSRTEGNCMGTTADGEGEKGDDSEVEEDNLEDSSDHMEVANDETSDNKGGVWYGFKLVGDNIDKNFKASFQRVDRSNQSLHYFNSYAVLDRIDFSSLKENPKSGEIDVHDLLPNSDDLKLMKSCFEVLVSRILVDYVGQYSDQKKDVVWHISHKYSKEMSRKSVTVPLGVYPLNENQLDQMCQILDRLQVYCPSKTGESGECVMRDILLGGDQLTCARGRTSKWLRSSHDPLEHALKGLEPVAEDWHTRMCLLKVIWLRLFNKKSLKERGTLYQLKNLLNRKAIPDDPGKNMKACEDFLYTIMCSHIVAAADALQEREGKVTDISSLIVRKFVNFLSEANHCNRKVGDEDLGNASMDADEDNELDEEGDGDDGQQGDGQQDEVEVHNDGDMVYAYGCEVLSMSLLWHCYHDAVREGDGERVMVVWKYLLLIFMKAGRTNYTKELLIQLLQNKFLFSERKAAQLKWDRFVNTQGRPGCNVPADLHMEHLNKQFKGVLRNIGSNIQPHSIVRASKALGVVHDVSLALESELFSGKSSGKHKAPSMIKDVEKILDVLKEEKVFERSHDNRQHASLKFKRGLLTTINREDITSKLLEKSLNATVLL